MLKIFSKNKSLKKEPEQTMRLMNDYLYSQLQQVIEGMHNYDVTFEYPKATVSASQIIADLEREGYDIQKLVIDIMAGKLHTAKTCEITLYRKA